MSASKRPPRGERPHGEQIPRLQPKVEGIHIGAPPQSQTPVVTEPVSHRATEPGSGEVPRWRTLVRKEARLRADQADALAGLRRRLIAGRHDRTEVITDNTLIRVAVDLLLDHADALTGDTEDQLRESVTNRVTGSQTP